jgi:hypothetical protein
MCPEFNLNRVPEGLRKLARERLEAGDIIGALSTMENMVCPFFVFDNVIPLKDAGLLEIATITAWNGVRFNRRHTGPIFPILFEYADREKLRNYGDPLPGTGPFKIYRGCSGTGRARKVRGYSWTASLERAKWFAKRFKLQHPAVYCINRCPETWILFYLNQSFRKEEEFVVLVPEDAGIVRIWRGKEDG